MYSLISAPVVGFDLARMGGGDAVAQVLACALRLDEQGLLTLGALAREYAQASGADQDAGTQDCDVVADQRERARLGAWLDVSVVSQGTANAGGAFSGLSTSLLQSVEKLNEPTAALPESGQQGQGGEGAGSSAPAEDQSENQTENQSENQLEDQPANPGSAAESAPDNPVEKLTHTLQVRASDHAAIAAVLEQAPLGSLDALLRCLREEILDWVEPLKEERSELEAGLMASGISLLCDAAAAGYTQDLLPADAFDTLWQPWQRGYAQLDRRYRGERGAGDGARIPFPVTGMTPTGPSLNPQVRYLLDVVRQASQEQIKQMAQASSRWRFRDPSWSAAVHDASWAVSLSGRTREAALAQMHLVQICRQVNWPVAALAGGDWNTISGAVHALVVRDLVGSENLHRLLAPCMEVFGPLGTDLGEQAA